MYKKVIQLRYFGDTTINFNNKNGDNSITHKMIQNQPEDLTSSVLMSGEIFEKYQPIIQLGVQTLPGVKMCLNSNLDPIIIGASGIYELDLTDSSVKITEIQFDSESLTLINNSPDGYLIIDLVYQEE